MSRKGTMTGKLLHGECYGGSMLHSKLSMGKLTTLASISFCLWNLFEQISRGDWGLRRNSRNINAIIDELGF